MSLIKKKHLPHYTYKDYLEWEGRWELILGIPYAMALMPSVKHQRISGQIHQQLALLLENCEKCEALLPVDWKLADDIIVQPDNLIICNEVYNGDVLEVIPKLIFEIFSPSSIKKDKQVKFNLYEKAHVKYYILVDPDKEKFELFQLVRNKYKIVKKLNNYIYDFDLDDCKITFDFNRIFSR